MRGVRSLNAAWRTGWWRSCSQPKRAATLIEISASLGKFAAMGKYASHPPACGFLCASKLAPTFGEFLFMFVEFKMFFFFRSSGEMEHFIFLNSSSSSVKCADLILKNIKTAKKKHHRHQK